MKKVITFFCLLLLTISCYNDDLFYHIDFHNNSGKSVCYYLPWRQGVFYPDTILPNEKITNPREFEKKTNFTFGEGNFHENTLFALFPTDTMSIFFFDPYTLAKYDWQTVREEYKILVRYDLSHSDLKKLKWQIYYPPTEAMKDMKMYPPYQ